MGREEEWVNKRCNLPTLVEQTGWRRGLGKLTRDSLLMTAALPPGRWMVSNFSQNFWATPVQKIVLLSLHLSLGDNQALRPMR